MSLLGIKILKNNNVSMIGTSILYAEGVIPLSNETKSILLYANQVFIEPFKSKKYSLIEENYFNFEYIIDKLTRILNQNHTNGNIYKLIDTYINTIYSIQRAMDIRLSLTNAFRDAFSDKHTNSVILETSRLSVSSVYFIYNYLIGIPVHSTNYDQKKLNIIKTILINCPGITMENLRNNPDIINIITEPSVVDEILC